MREGDGPTVADLLSELRHHRTRRTQHITEPNHAELGTRMVDCQGLQRHLSQAFTGAHNVGRPHCLVGTDQHKIGDAIFCSRLGGTQRTQHIVLDALSRVMLNQGHVFVSGSMVDRVRVPGRHNLAHAIVVLHRG